MSGSVQVRQLNPQLSVLGGSGIEIPEAAAKLPGYRMARPDKSDPDELFILAVFDRDAIQAAWL
jgi:hypothetical protein